MKDIPAIKGRHYIASLIEQGEHECQDFKYMISDARKIARSISAFANNSGGRLLIGVKDNGTAAGIRNEEDIYVVESAAQIYCRPAVDIKFTAFKVDPGIIVIRAEIPQSPTPPVKVVEADGQLKAYYRVKDENILAPDVMIESWLMNQSTEESLIDFSNSHLRLLELINQEGEITLDRFISDTHISTSAATHIAAQLIATRSIIPVYHNQTWLLSLPQN